MTETSPKTDKKGRIIIHCGGSKNGSTALQSSLLREVETLHARGISALRLSCVLKSRFEDELSLEECDITWGADPPEDLTGRDYTTSFAKLYEVYKIHRERRDIRGLLALGHRIMDSLEAALRDYHTIVVSAEALETSLCMRDLFFKRLIRTMASLADVDLVYYEPDAARHAIGSWQQWAYIEKIAYSEWLDTYVNKVSAGSFFSSRGKPYFANLIDIAGWMDYWRGLRNVTLFHFQDIKDVRMHFHQHFLRRMDVKDDTDLSIHERNDGWPKGHLKSLPLFYEFLAGNYEKYEVLKVLLISKAAGENMEFYKELLLLTRRFLNSDGNAGVSTLRSEIQLRIDRLFSEISPTEIAKVYTYLADTVYHYHLVAVGASGSRLRGGYIAADI